ncbi:MAG: thiaminase II, partial [Fastidiosipilaceae bacterium]
EVENTPTALANSTYTSYMLNVAQIYGLPELIVSILSCAWTYEMIADTLLERYPDAADHEFYGQWIRTYTGKDFKNTNVQIIAMTEELCADAFKNPAHLERLTDVFVKCCRLEMGFWDMAWDMAL